MPRETEHEREYIIKVIRRARGKVTLAAQMLDVTPQTVYNYANRWKTVSDAIDEARRDFREGLADSAEIKLLKAVQNDRAWAIKYALNTQAKDRGYVERQEFAGPGGKDISISVSGPNISDEI